MARSGAVAVLAVFLVLAGVSFARARVLACPSVTVIDSGEVSGIEASNAGAVSHAAGAVAEADNAARGRQSDLSCAPADPPCALTFGHTKATTIIRSKEGDYRYTARWTLSAICRKAPSTPGASHVTLPPSGSPTSSTPGGGGASPGGGALAPGAPAPPLADCRNCQQQSQLLAELQADLAKTEAEEHALTGKIKSAQVLGEPTGALEAQLASNASEQAVLRAQITVIQGKLKNCPRVCEQPGANVSLPPQGQNVQLPPPGGQSPR